MRLVVVPTFVSLTLPIAEVLEILTGIGVQLVELHGNAPDTHIDLTDESQVARLGGVVEDLPLKIHSVHCPYSSPSWDAWDISHPNRSIRDAAIGKTRKVLDAAAVLGVGHTVIHPGIMARGGSRLEDSRDSLEVLSKHARAVGVKMAVENLPPGFVCESVDEMRALIEALDSETVGFCLDTGHALMGKNSPADYVRALDDRLIAMHWHDNNGDRDAHMFPGTGGTNWKDLFTALDEVGYHSPVTTEAHPPAWLPLPDAVNLAGESLLNGMTPDIAR